MCFSDSIFSEGVELLSSYLQIDTTNPPGNEEGGAVFLKEVLEKEGIPARIYFSAPGRANLLARIPGDGSRGALLLLNHIDVVGAVEKDWKYPPFSGRVEEGAIWGRGALDCKGLGIMELMAFLLVKRNRVKLKRDLIFLAVADEETGGEFGAGWMTQNYPEEVRSEFCLNEGGMGAIGLFGKDSQVYSVGFGEKGVLWLRVRAHGKAGHGSIPHSENANDRLVKALNRILNYQTPIRVVSGMKEAFKELRRGSLIRYLLVRFIGNPLILNLFRSRLKSYPKINAVLRNTISLTRLNAGFKENVIPSESEAILDCRLLPEENPQDFIERIKKIVRDEGIEVQVVKESHSSQSPLRTEFFGVISRVLTANHPSCRVVPMISAGFTDSRYFRNLGSVAYGLVPALFEPAEIEAMHGVNERISLDAFRWGIKNLYDIILGMNQV